MPSETPSRGSSLVLLLASAPILGLGLYLMPWATTYADSTMGSFSQSVRDSGEFAFAIAGFLLFCGGGGVVYAIRDLIVGPSKRR